MITKTSKIIISKIYNLNSIDNIIDFYVNENFIFIISKDLIIHLINRSNNRVFSFKFIIFEKEDNILFEFVKIVDIKKINENVFKVSLLIKNIVKGIYLLNAYLIINELKILLNDYHYLDFRFINLINHENSLSNSSNTTTNNNNFFKDILILLDNGIYSINSNSFIYKTDDILKSSYIEIKDIIYSFLINQNLFFIDKKGFIFIFEINKNKELNFINSIFLDSFYHKDLKNIKHFYAKNNVFIFFDNLIYAISNLDNTKEIKIKKYFPWELSKDFYLLPKSSSEIFKDIILYENNYYLLFENYLILLKLEYNNFKFVKIKDFEWEKENNLIKLKILNNHELWAFYKQKIWIFRNIFEDSSYNEVILLFDTNQKLLSIKDKYISGKLENKLKEKQILNHKEIFEILNNNNNNQLPGFKVISIKKYNESYLILLDVPLFGLCARQNVSFYPLSFENSPENHNLNYQKINIISTLDNLLFFKSENDYYFGELKFKFDPYIKAIIKNINKIDINSINKLTNTEKDEILTTPIKISNNDILFLHQKELVILNKESKKLNLKQLDLENANLAGIIVYFKDNSIYSFYIKDSNIVLKIYEINISNFQINISKEFILKNISDFYRNLLTNSVLLDLKILDDNKFFISVLKNNQIYNLEITHDNALQFKLTKNLKLNIENISNIFKINDTIFFVNNSKIYYTTLELNHFNSFKIFEKPKKINLQDNLELFTFNNLIIIGEIEKFSKWKKIIFTYTDEKILDILPYEDKLIIILENFIATDIPNKILKPEETNFIQSLKLNNVIYLKKYFKNKFLKENKLFLLDDIGDLWILDIQTKDLVKSYLGFLNEGEFYLIDNNIYIITKEGYSIKIEV